jgi:hypothetical protein
VIAAPASTTTPVMIQKTGLSKMVRLSPWGIGSSSMKTLIR